IQGRLVGPSGRRSELRLKVRLESSGQGDLYVFSDPNGTFRFNSLRPGHYTVVVEGGEDFETVRESALLEAMNVSTRRGVIGAPVPRPLTLQIYLRPKRGASNQAQPGVLNAALASVPKPAADLYQKAVEHARKNEHQRAVDLLKLAVEAHPNFPLALSELGVLYLKLKQSEKAAGALGAALKLAPEDHSTLLAYGRALLDLQRLSESEEQFRKALKKNAASPWAHFYLGMILLKRRQHDSAEAELKNAVSSGGGQMALAHYYLGGIYWNKGQYRQAADELETYLRLAPNAPDAARLRETIKEFRKKK
ncbi:MAG: tetratricopeptide repeat protein, partial [Acidobacteriota bacterium]|nr:tetratricopeptide repeat protein [Acidobacteriota bacterium]